jgi:peroxin-19
MDRVKELSSLLESENDTNTNHSASSSSTTTSTQSQSTAQPSTEELAARLRAIAESTRESTDTLFNAASGGINAANGASNVPGEADEAMLERVLQQLDAEPGMQGAMQELVQQIMSKDVLYEPMVELRDKYPQWLAANQLSLSSEDRARYTRQHQLIGMICQEYERTDVNYDRLTDLMAAVQELGQPPREIVSQLAPDFPLDAAGQPQVSPENCVVQ